MRNEQDLTRVADRNRERLRFLLLLAFAVLGLRLAWVQLHPAPGIEARDRAQGFRPRRLHGTTLAERGYRGMILDRNSRLLATTSFDHALVCDPWLWQRHTRREDVDALHCEEILRTLLSQVGPAPSLETLRAKLYAERVTDSGKRIRRRYAALTRSIPPPLVRDTEAFLRRARLPGLSVEPRETRNYPYGGALSPVVGHLGDVKSEKKKERGYRARSGVELGLDSLLAGQSGAFEALRDGRGRESLPALGQDYRGGHGHDVVLSIDTELQLRATDALSRQMEATGARVGSAVLMDVRNGDLLALVSLPHPDFEKASGFRHQRLRPLMERYAPGSTAKVMWYAYALQEQVLSPGEVLDCGGASGTARVGRRPIREYSPNPQPLSPEMALVRSSNVAAARVTEERLGTDRCYRALEAFGVNTPCVPWFPFSLPAGVVPRDAVNPGWTVPTMGMGYCIAVTPVMQARIFSVLATGGVQVEPRLLLHATRRDGSFSVPVRKHRVIAEGPARWVAAAMRQVVENRRGTGRRARLDGWSLAGKTGTAEDHGDKHAKQGYYHAWFCGFAPATDPVFVIVVHQHIQRRAGRPYTGGAASGPAAKEILEAALDRYAIPKDNDRLGQEHP